MITKATVDNEWIPLNKKKNGTETKEGVSVKRTVKTFSIILEEPDENNKSIVLDCNIGYLQREFYPNGEIIVTESKNYKLEDLARKDIGDTQHMEELAVLTGFINLLGQKEIIDRIKLTLSDDEKLSINAENNYPLNRDTRKVVYNK